MSLSAPIEPSRAGAPPVRRAGRAEFSLASTEDDAAIRAFLAGGHVGMPGRIGFETRTEPSFHGAVELLGNHPDILIARDCERDGIVGLGVRTIRRVLVQGRSRQVGHLSFLRVAPDFRRRRDFIVAGYRLLHDLQELRPVDFSLTAILADNFPARRLLEARLSGLPVYQPLAIVHTFTLATPRLPEKILPAAVSSQAMSKFLSSRFQDVDLAPDLRYPMVVNDGPPGRLAWNDFMTQHQDGRLVAAAALWDQRSVRQTHIAHYTGVLKYLRPWLNIFQRLKRKPGLPPVGPLNLGYVSHLAMDPNAHDAGEPLLQSLLSAARIRGLDFVILSLVEGHPLFPIAARLASHRIESTLYAVHWPEQTLPSLRCTPYVEAALL